MNFGQREILSVDLFDLHVTHAFSRWVDVVKEGQLIVIGILVDVVAYRFTVDTQIHDGKKPEAILTTVTSIPEINLMHGRRHQQIDFPIRFDVVVCVCDTMSVQSVVDIVVVTARRVGAVESRALCGGLLDGDVNERRTATDHLHFGETQKLFDILRDFHVLSPLWFGKVHLKYSGSDGPCSNSVIGFVVECHFTVFVVI